MTDPTPTRAKVLTAIERLMLHVEHDMSPPDLVDLHAEMEALRERAEAAEALVRDYEEAAADKRRLTRVLDVALNGVAGAAQQASLCDLIGCAMTLRERAEAREKRMTELAHALAALVLNIDAGGATLSAMADARTLLAEVAQEGQP